MKITNFLTKYKDSLLTIFFAALVVIFPFSTDNDYYIHIGCMIGVNILLALGMHAVTGLAGQINMGQYGFYCIGAYACAVISTKSGMGFFPTILLTIGITAVFGLIVGIPSLRIEGPYLALATIGFAESVRLIINSAAWAGKANGVMRIPPLEIFGLTMQNKGQSFYFIMAFVLICIVIINNLMRSNYGNRFKAIKDDPLAASVIGIDVAKIKLLAFSISAIFGGVAGALYARYAGYINPMTFITALQTNYMLMVVLGGLGSSWGAVFGAAMVTVVYEYTRAYVQYQKIAFGVLMILIVLFLQRGVVGTVAYHNQQKSILEQHKAESGQTTSKVRS